MYKNNKTDHIIQAPFSSYNIIYSICNHIARICVDEVGCISV